jgi:hypothetical protein
VQAQVQHEMALHGVALRQVQHEMALHGVALRTVVIDNQTQQTIEHK